MTARPNCSVLSKHTTNTTVTAGHKSRAESRRRTVRSSNHNPRQSSGTSPHPVKPRDGVPRESYAESEPEAQARIPTFSPNPKRKRGIGARPPDECQTLACAAGSVVTLACASGSDWTSMSAVNAQACRPCATRVDSARDYLGRTRVRLTGASSGSEIATGAP